MTAPEAATWDDAAWAALAAELDAWKAAGRPATLWWRDDDAGAADPALDRLLDLAGRRELPLGVAVVPAWLTPEGRRALAGAPGGVVTLQHGFAHANHETVAAPGEPKVRPAEAGAVRPAAVVLAELAEGWDRLRAALGPRCLPVLVPPWNRIAPGLLDALPGLGYRALSAFGARPWPAGPDQFRRLNCHVDPILWRQGRRFAGPAATLGALRAHLADRRAGRADPAEPTGLLTHHRDLSPTLWAFLEELLDRLRAHPATAFVPVERLLAGQSC